MKNLGIVEYVEFVTYKTLLKNYFEVYIICLDVNQTNKAYQIIIVPSPRIEFYLM